MKAKKLIEVAMPIKEISAESKRDKSLRHGHISTLQYWLARRPLPVCRAVVFASLVPDPLDDNCPIAFKEAVFDLLQKEGIDKITYSPYPDIPYTAIYDPMEENLRNRLLMFIGKFSSKCQNNMLAGKTTSPNDQLIDGCLIKWESKNDERVLEKARKLIWVAYNAEKYPEKNYEQLSSAFDSAYKAIKDAEEALYSTKDRHQRTAEVISLEDALRNAIETFQSNMPSVFDPFAGGGAIPLEAARLGCRSFGNDINPVAHIIEKGSVEYPQRYGKPICYSSQEFDEKYGKLGRDLLNERDLCQLNSEIVLIPNRLSFDVEYYSRILLQKSEALVSKYYPQNAQGEKPVGYYWVRTANCLNPSCGHSIPLLKSFILSAKSNNEHSFYPEYQNGELIFPIKKGKNSSQAYYSRATVRCPYCGSVIDPDSLKEQSVKSGLNHKLMALIYEDSNGKRYEMPDKVNESIISTIPEPVNKPNEKMHPNSGGGDTFGWGIDHYAQLFSKRQLNSINAIIDVFNELKQDLLKDEYGKSIIVYLSLLVNRITPRSNMFVLFNTNGENLEHIYRNQAIPMVFDYPESGIFCSSIGGAYNQIEWITKYIESESRNPYFATCCKSASGDKMQFGTKTIDSVVTDPPYYDAMAYADFSDFYYLWFKRMLVDVLPDIVNTPQTPKTDECTALKHYHGDDMENAKRHFENMLLQIFKSIEYQTKDIVSIMFAHQSTDAWTTLCNSIIGANMNINGSWAIDSERSNAGLKTDKAFLESSVTVACRPSERKGYANFKKIKEAIRETVSKEVRTLYNLGFRGADLLTACFGKAVSEFGNYETVEKSDGSEVSVSELLDLARTSAFTALLRDFTGDDYTKFYIGWLQMNGMGDTDFDDATKFTRVGMNVNVADIQRVSLLIKSDGSTKQHLASYNERGFLCLRNMSDDKPLIDKVHLAMKLWESGQRNYLLPYIAQYGNDINNEFWRVLVVLKELLPITTDDYTQVLGLLQNAESLIRDSKDIHVTTDNGPTLFDGLE